MKHKSLLQQSAVAVVFTYLLLAGGTLNGLAQYQVINVSLGLLALIGVGWLGWTWWRRQPVALSPLTLVYAAFVAAYALSSLFSIDPRRSLNALLLTLLYFLLWVLVTDLLSRGWPAESLTRAFVVVGTLIIALALWQTVRYAQDWLAASGGQPLIPPVILRPNPLLTHANMVAAFLNLLWPLLLVQLLGGQSWLGRIVAASWILLAWAVILLASSRGAWLGTAAALPVTVALGWLAGQTAPWSALRRRLSAVSQRAVAARWLAAGLAALLLLAAVGAVGARLLRNPTHGVGFGSRQLFWEAAWQAFLADPLSGQGPDTYVTAYLGHVSIPPNELYVRAHSQVMQLLAENGLLGILSGAALLATAGWAAVRRWRAATVTQRRSLAGVVGALAATAVHGLFDTPSAVPVNAMLIVALAAISTTAPRPVERQRGAAAWRAALTLLLLAVLAAGAWSQSAYPPYLDGLAAVDRGDWPAAAPLLETAVARDPDHTLYNMASATVHGVLAAQGDEGALSIAIARYQAAIAHEPGYGLNSANLAALYWQQGQTDLALSMIEQAIAAAPEEPTLWLNLGLDHEQRDALPAAQEAYERVLELRPAWAESYFWRANDWRRTLRDAWQTAHPLANSSTQQAAIDLAAGRYEPALAFYEQALAANPLWMDGYVGHAAALIGLGRYAQADRDLRIVTLIGQADSNAVVTAAWLRAEQAYRQGDLPAAILRGEQALDVLRQQPAWGSVINSPALYGWAAFYRLVVRADALPQLQLVRYLDHHVVWMETLGGWYEEAGDLEGARRLYRQAQQAAPDTVVAVERLEALGP